MEIGGSQDSSASYKACDIAIYLDPRTQPQQGAVLSRTVGRRDHWAN